MREVSDPGPSKDERLTRKLTVLSIYTLLALYLVVPMPVIVGWIKNVVVSYYEAVVK